MRQISPQKSTGAARRGQRRPPYGHGPSAGLAYLLLVLGVGLGAQARAADTEITITIKDHHFVPSEVAAPAGQKLKLIVKNEDPTASEFESVDFHREKVVAPGHEITVFVGPLDGGSYEFFDDFHPDTRGHLVVK